MTKNKGIYRRFWIGAVFLIGGTFVLSSCAHNISNRNMENNLAVGMGHMDYGHYKMARASFQEVLTTNPQNAAAHYELGRLEAIQGNAEEAEAQFREVLKTQPNNASAHLSLGWVLVSKSILPGAEQHFRRALTLGEEVAPSYAGLGAVRLLQNAADQAQKGFKRSLSVDPKDPMAHHFLALMSSTDTAPRAGTKEFLPYAARRTFKKYSQTIPDVLEKRRKDEEARQAEMEG